MGFPKLGRGDSGCRPKSPGECAVVGESALVRDVCDRAVGITQGLRSGRDARLGDQLNGGDAKDSLDDADKSRGRHLCDAGKARWRNRFRVTRFQVQQGGVMVESEPEHGSFFTVWLPAAEPGI